MCFCAEASFIASAGLGAAGAATWKIAPKKLKIAALIPLGFAIQQFIEGLQWVVPKPSLESTVLGYGFLLFAFLIWPSLIPYISFATEKSEKRKEILKWIIPYGAAITLYLLAMLFLYPLSVAVTGRHIDYHIFFPLRGTMSVLYLFAIHLPLFLSTDKYVKWFGAVLLASVAASWLFYLEAYTSVWCFFAAALSVLVYFYIRKRKSE